MINREPDNGPWGSESSSPAAVLKSSGVSSPRELRPDTAPVACFPHETESAARREEGPLNAVARGTDGYYVGLTVPKSEWAEWTADDRRQWCLAHGFELAEEALP